MYCWYYQLSWSKVFWRSVKSSTEAIAVLAGGKAVESWIAAEIPFPFLISSLSAVFLLLPDRVTCALPISSEEITKWSKMFPAWLNSYKTKTWKIVSFFVYVVLMYGCGYISVYHSKNITFSWIFGTTYKFMRIQRSTIWRHSPERDESDKGAKATGTDKQDSGKGWSLRVQDVWSS